VVAHVVDEANASTNTSTVSSTVSSTFTSTTAPPNAEETQAAATTSSHVDANSVMAIDPNDIEIYTVPEDEANVTLGGVTGTAGGVSGGVSFLRQIN
jgi:hypothetical protein